VQISKYVNRWQWNPKHYEEKILNRWQIVLAANRKKERNTPTAKINKSDISDDDDSEVSSSASSDSDNNIKVKKKVLPGEDCWKKLIQGAGVLTISIRIPEYPGLV
jgi:hypothetical protein